MSGDGDWIEITDANIAEIEQEIRAKQEAALAALPGDLQQSFDAKWGAGWCAEHPELFAEAVQFAQASFLRIAAEHWEHFHAMGAAGFPQVH